MSLAQSPLPITADEYLAMERKSEERHEYLDGTVYAMAGESLEHGTICMNLSRIISSQLLGKPCQAISKDIKVRSGPRPKSRRSTKGLYSYPDLVSLLWRGGIPRRPPGRASQPSGYHRSVVADN
jgi:Uma2 family endonuclease